MIGQNVASYSLVKDDIYQMRNKEAKRETFDRNYLFQRSRRGLGKLFSGTLYGLYL